MDALSRRHQASLRLFLHRICEDSADADDFAQEAFIASWQKISQLKEPSAYKSWLFASAIRLVKDRRKSRNRSRHREQAWYNHQSLHSADTDSNMAKHDVEQALDNLPEKERMVASLIYGAGFSQSETSRVTKIPLGSVKTYCLRARAVLVSQLEDWNVQNQPSTRGDTQ